MVSLSATFHSSRPTSHLLRFSLSLPRTPPTPMEIEYDYLYSDVFLAVRPGVSASSPPLAAADADATTSVAAALSDGNWLLGWAAADEYPNQNPSKITADVADQEQPKTVIPGLGTAVSPTERDDWDDSDSEDDLKIVLNDTEHGTMDDLGYGDRDEEEDLVTVTNDDQIGVLDQDWGEEGAGPGGEGEGTGPSRIGRNNHAFHQHHSMYKYVRPGAPVPGGPAGGVAGPQGQLRPPLLTEPYPGRGRGDWRPAGARMMNGRGYGMSSFSLPPQKTIFDFEIDNFDEKPWRHPKADQTDYFNLGFNLELWKDYFKRLASFHYYSPQVFIYLILSTVI